jgi:hypothetical protein
LVHFTIRVRHMAIIVILLSNFMSIIETRTISLNDNILSCVLALLHYDCRSEDSIGARDLSCDLI